MRRYHFEHRLHQYDPEDFGKVAVLMGGDSSEREVSLESGRAVLNALIDYGINAREFDPKEKNIFDLKLLGFERAFVALHGGAGEDGHVQAILDTMHIPYTGSGMLASGICMNKVIAKHIFRSQGISTPEFFVIHSAEELNYAAEQISYPLVLKPIEGGSSIATSFVRSKVELMDAYLKTLSYGPCLMEKAIIGKEVTVGIIEGEALPILEIASAGFFDFEAKYEQPFCGKAANLPPELDKKISHMCETAFKITGCKGWARLDIMLDAHNEPYVLEINTVPGLTSHSLVPYAASLAGIEFSTLAAGILSASLPINIKQARV